VDIQELMNKVAQNLSVGRAFGSAYDKDGVMVIPVALVAGGGGGGEGTTASLGDDAQTDQPDEAGAGVGGPSSGSGGGFGGVVVPVGVYVVKDDQVRWVPAVNATVVVLGVLGIIRLLVRSRARASRRRGH
jgi:uncharacterized spore protein YtfJ